MMATNLYHQNGDDDVEEEEFYNRRIMDSLPVTDDSIDGKIPNISNE